MLDGSLVLVSLADDIGTAPLISGRFSSVGIVTLLDDVDIGYCSKTGWQAEISHPMMLAAMLNLIDMLAIICLNYIGAENNSILS